MLKFITKLLGKNQAIEQKNRKKAAMSLNLCAASISRIIDSQSLDIMEVEYDTILNNLNLQNIIKDEALLTTMRSILDTISFYRLQAGDRKRVDARFQHKMNNALWDGLGKVNITMIGSEPWTTAAMAVIQVGSAYCSIRRSKSQTVLEHDDEIWRLERSALEQLHALRCSLFETAWRLADTYDFDDAWRLTVKQIEQYNKILDEHDPVWRYSKLKQYQDDFQAYPYFWFELAEAAFQSATAVEAQEKFFMEEAQSALKIFEENDLQLLRQDIIGASAKLRRVQILYKKNNSWTKAIQATSDTLHSLQKMAFDAPDLLMNAAICYAAAYQESKNPKYAAYAIDFLERLVNLNYNMPTTSRLLSALYMQEQKQEEYLLLKRRVGAKAVVKDGEDLETMFKPDRDELLDRCKCQLDRQMRIAMRLCFPDIFNCPTAEINENLSRELKSKGNLRDNTVKTDMFSKWETMKVELNNQMLVLRNIFGIDDNNISKVAQNLDAVVTDAINKFSGTLVEKMLSSSNRIIEQQKAYIALFKLIESSYVKKVGELLSETLSTKKYDDITNLEFASEALGARLEAQIQDNHLVGFETSDRMEAPVDFFSVKLSACSKSITLQSLRAAPGILKDLIKNKLSFEIIHLPISELTSLPTEIERVIEQQKMTSRVYTKWLNNYLFTYGAAHRFMTYDPDYEIIRYLNKLKVVYMRDSVEDISSDRINIESSGETEGANDSKNEKSWWGKINLF